MKSIIELGIIFLLLSFSVGKLPSVIKNARQGQLYLLKESTSSNWGKPWVPRSKSP
jgi:hypothetical protein